MPFPEKKMKRFSKKLVRTQVSLNFEELTPPERGLQAHPDPPWGEGT